MTHSITTPHTDAVLCCAVMEERKLLLSGGEDARLCLTDLTAMSSVGCLQREQPEAVPSVCCSAADGHSVFAAAGQVVLHLDLRRSLGEEAVLATYSINKDEVNCVAVNAAGLWLAAADDTGEIQVISLTGSGSGGGGGGGAAGPAYKTLRRGHTNICSSVAFRSHRPWELLSGGLDCSLVCWDFNRLRPRDAWEAAAQATASGGQVFNPPMVHALAVPQTEDRAVCRWAAVGRGDGCVVLYDADFRPAAATHTPGKGPKRGGKAKPARSTAADPDAPARPPTALLKLLGPEQGGHTAAVNSVCFAAGSGWRGLLSAGNDRRLLLWDLGVGGGEAGGEAAAATAAGPAAELRHSAKINCVCSSDAAPGYNVYLTDVAGRLTAASLETHS